MSDASSEPDPVERLADEFLRRYRQGERPPLTEYVRQYPQWADRIRKVFPALALMEGVRPDTGEATGADVGVAPACEGHRLERVGDYRILREVGRGGMGVVYEAEQESLGRHVALKVLPGHARLDARHLMRFRREARAAARLHHTNIVPVYGVGEEAGLHYYVMQFIQGLGLDEVLAEVRRLRQAEPSPGGGAGEGAARGRGEEVSATDVARGLLTGHFVAGPSEPAQAAAAAPTSLPPRAKDPAALVPLPPPQSSEASRKAGVHLPGQPEAANLSDSGRPYWRSVARVGIQVAEALAHAHGQGVLHRDVKPSNLLLDQHGNVWVTDFGLAKAGDSEDLTHTGDIVGTVRYLSPERFEGRGDARSDVYALGLTLYELLTLRPAFDRVDRNGLIAQVMRADPPPPRQVSPGVPRDLETVVLKAIERDPGRRYPTAAELAADLLRFLEDRPIRARRVGPAERAWRWCRRNPAAALLVLVSGVAALALAGLAVGAAYYRELDRAKERTEGALQAEAAARRDEAGARYALDIATGHAGWREGDLRGVEDTLDDCPPDRRGWEWHYLKRLCHADSLTLTGHTGGVSSVAWSPDGRWLASACEDGAVRVWDTATGQPSLLRGHEGTVQSVLFSPDGTRLASVARDETVAIWDVATGKVVHTLPAGWPAHPGMRRLAFSPDGRWLAATGRRRENGRPNGTATVRVWETSTGQPVSSFPQGQVEAEDAIALAFRPDRAQLVLAEGHGGPTVVRVWDCPDGRVLREFARSRYTTITRIRFSPDGRRLALAGMHREVEVLDAATGAVALDLSPKTRKTHPGGVADVAFSPGGGQLASASGDGTVHLWDAANGDDLGDLRGHVRGVTELAFSPDGGRLASASRDGTVKVWSVGAGPAGPAPGTRPEYVSSVAFSPDGHRLAWASHVGTVTVRDVATGRDLFTLTHRDGDPGEGWWLGSVVGVAFSPDGRRLASLSADEAVNVWDLATRRVTAALPGRTGPGADRLPGRPPMLGVAISPGGDWLALTSADRAVKLWDMQPGSEPVPLGGHTGTVVSVAFSPDGRRLASGGEDGGVRVWDLATREPVHTLPHPRGVSCVAFSPDGSQLAAACRDETVTIWDARTGQAIRPLTGHSDGVRVVAFSPDGRRLASGGVDQLVRVWDVETGRPLLTLKGHTITVQCVAFSPDGRLASGSFDGTVRVWDGRPWPAGGEDAVEREAVGLLDFLFGLPLREADVADHVRHSPGIRPPVRQSALSLAAHYREEADPEKYHRAGWAVARRPHLNDVQYGLALRQAEAACALAAGRARDFTARSAAWCLARQYPAAWGALARADRHGRRLPAYLALLAVAQHRLGRAEQARAALGRAREAAGRPGWVGDGGPADLIREASALIEGRSAGPGQ